MVILAMEVIVILVVVRGGYDGDCGGGGGDGSGWLHLGGLTADDCSE